MAAIVSTIPEKCKRCYTCVRECPAKAIKVEGGQAMVIEERCIACGNCVKVCAQNAKLIKDSSGKVRELLAGEEPVFACIAPSFPAAFHNAAPGKVVAAVRELGFTEVWEVAFGAELISLEYEKLFKKSRQTGAQIISTPCPAIIAYIEKFMPSLHGSLAPIVSPMIAVARAVRHRNKNGIRVVFIGPCIAKKNEIHDPSVAGAVDAVLTFRELDTMFKEDGIAVEEMPESGFDGPRCYLGRAFPLSSGLLKTAGLNADILETDIVVADGKDSVLEALHEVAEGRSQARFYDVLFCNGCIAGPKMLNDLSIFARKSILANYVNEQNRQTSQRELAESLAEFAEVDLSRTFTRQNVELPQPSEEQIGNALRAMKKFTPEDQLNCGACGYHTCREKAIAVCQGLAEPEMCLPFLVEEMEAKCGELTRSHQELASAQARLVQTEKLASMGQLSAGVAHEINNPLGTVLLYSHLLLRQLDEADPRKEDIGMIVSEATRCRDIVRGLLNFARQSRVSKRPTELSEVVVEVMALMSVRTGGTDVVLKSDVQEDLPEMMLDAAQIKQLLVNLVGNSLDAVGEDGEVCIKVGLNRQGDAVEIRVIDNGCGIPEKNLPKLFTPFFTTKAEGKGTGLGLAVAYGIVKMHCGDIVAESENGKGTTFIVTIPLEQQEARESLKWQSNQE